MTIPYVKGMSEALHRTFKKYDISAAMKPVNILVHPKDKRKLEDNSGVIYKIPCASCDAAYVGETARNFGVRLKEHKKDVDAISSNRPFTRAERKASQSEFNKSAVTDHAVKNNHVIDWENVSLLDRESIDYRRKIRESIWIKQTTNSMNREEGSYRVSPIYNVLFSTPPGGKIHH